MIAVHMGGTPAQIEALASVCRESDLVLIEDCAQAVGAQVGNKKLGNFGEMAIFSFYPTKNLGAMGDAGCIATKNAERVDRLQALRDYGRTGRKEFTFEGRNSRMDELQAAILSFKLKILSKWNARRVEIASRYNQSLGLVVPDSGSVFYHYYWRGFDSAKSLTKLTEAGIGYDTLESNLMEQIPFFKKYQRSENPIARQLANEIVCLPLYPELTEEEVAYICQFLEKNKS